MSAEVKALPLFPLNVVLFPGQSLPLHIFEPRYRVMIQQCIDQKEPFGVVLALDENNLAEVGTAAMVMEVERTDDGRLNIETVGTERFKLRDWTIGEQGYLVGNVESFPFEEELEDDTVLFDRVQIRMKRYLKLIAKTSGINFQVDRFPTDPQQMAVLTAIALQVELEDKQDLLETHSVRELLQIEDDILADEIKMLTITAAAIKPPQDDFMFSRN